MEIVIVTLMIVVVGLVMAVLAAKALGGERKGVVDDKLKEEMGEISRRMERLTEVMGEKLDRNNAAVQSSVMKQLSESSKLVGDVSARLAKLDETNKRVVSVADELKTLQNVLSNPKQRGVFGEFYLESVLENVLPAGQYKMQHKFKDGKIVDAVVLLDKGKMLPVDSKFSLENYNRMIEAEGEEREKYLAKVKADLKGRIDETSGYIRPREGTMDFAFMFIPSESLYYDLLVGGVGTGVSSRDLIEYAFRDRKVIIVSPTSFMAYLQTVLQGLRSLQIEKEAKEIQARVAKLGVHIGKFDEYMVKLGNSLGTTVGHYNSAYKEVEKVDKDVVKIAGSERQIEANVVEKPAGK
ncbi:DNA recombination protein RmuC [Candidatus Saccharibacteria bacterium]|nr:DNA recombination protein RmuC [Candidatus Saccharibacteria bacterium]